MPPKRRTRITPKRAKRATRAAASGREDEHALQQNFSDEQIQHEDVEKATTRRRMSTEEKRANNKKAKAEKVKSSSTRASSSEDIDRDHATVSALAGNVSERIRDIEVSKKTYDKWQPLSSPSKDFIRQVLEQTIPSILSTFPEKHREEIQQHLMQLNKSTSHMLDDLKAPKSKSNYHGIEAKSRILEKELLLKSSQLAFLEKELEEQQRLLEEETKEIDSYSNQLVDENIHTQLHPFLQVEPIQTLNLPSLPEKSIRKPVLQIPLDAKRGSAASLTQALVTLNDQVNQLGTLQHWLETVSLVKSRLDRQATNNDGLTADDCDLII